MNTTYYSIQVLDEGFPKLIPHTKRGKHCEFLDKKKAIEFLNELRANNPNDKFRLLSRKETYKFDSWT